MTREADKRYNMDVGFLRQLFFSERVLSAAICQKLINIHSLTNILSSREEKSIDKDVPSRYVTYCAREVINRGKGRVLWTLKKVFLQKKQNLTC
jgi:hypothetical protein